MDGNDLACSFTHCPRNLFVKQRIWTTPTTSANCFFCGCADEGAFPVSMILYDISALNSDVWFQLVSLLVSLFNDQWSIVLFFIEFVDWIHFFQPNDELYITENVELPSYFSFIIKKKHKKVSALSFFNRKKTAEKFAIKITQKKKKKKEKSSARTDDGTPLDEPQPPGGHSAITGPRASSHESLLLLFIAGESNQIQSLQLFFDFFTVSGVTVIHLTPPLPPLPLLPPLRIWFHWYY